MSNRRKSRQERSRRAAAPPVAGTPHPFEGMEHWLWAIQDADEAERRGDAAAALAVIERRPYDPEGRLFWRTSRITGLQQLVQHGADLPGWARSRWVLAQAQHFLDESDRGPQSRVHRAVRVATELRGGLEALAGSDEHDKYAAVTDHDWVFRQVQLFELGGLEAFLTRGATPDLIAGCDRIEQWAHAPMGAYLYSGAIGDRLLWVDLAAMTSIETINIGSATRLLPGAHVIGRLVPVEDGVMFEGPPLAVPRGVACDVAADPAAWLSVLHAAADQVRDGTIVTYHREWRSLLSDVPTSQLHMLLLLRASQFDLDEMSPEVALCTAVLDLARSEIERAELPRADEWEDDEWDAWAHVHAALVDPEVVEALPAAVSADDVLLLEEIADSVAEPARSFLDATVRRLTAAA